MIFLYTFELTDAGRNTMIEVPASERPQIAPLFQSIHDSMVIAYLQGYMGNGYVDQLPNPMVGLIVSGEYSFWVGDSASPAAREMAESIFEYMEGDQTTAIYEEDGHGWRDLLLSISKNHPVEIPRYRIAQRDYDFDRITLRNFIDALPKEFELRRFDKELYAQAMAEDWSREFCETFVSAEAYLSQGFGFGVVHKGRLVAGASSMTVYDGGLEVQVATREEYRGKGLAMACAAALLLESMDRNVRPCWDAATLVSRHMAVKLGYEYLGEYSTVHLHL
jgi:GNAT superfamily N-acetyltransferase